MFCTLKPISDVKHVRMGLFWSNANNNKSNQQHHSFVLSLFGIDLWIESTAEKDQPRFSQFISEANYIRNLVDSKTEAIRLPRSLLSY